MSFVNLASSQSTWKGYEYCEEKKVKKYEKISDGCYQGVVTGTNQYNVYIDINHPRNSKCDCPFAKDRRVVCKHMVCLYFTIFPNEMKKFYDDILETEKEQEIYEEKLFDRVEKYVMNMSKRDLQRELIYILSDDYNDYIYDRFIKEHDLY